MNEKRDLRDTVDQLLKFEGRMAELKKEIAEAAKAKAEQLISQNELTIVVAKLRDQLFGIPIAYIKEVIQMVEVTKIPNSSPSIAGIINLRGRVIPVINLERKFGHKERDYNPNMAIIVAEKGEDIAGLIVDSVEDVHTFLRRDIGFSSDLKQLPPMIVGAIKTEERPIFLINIEHLFDAMDFEALSLIMAEKGVLESQEYEDERK